MTTKAQRAQSEKTMNHVDRMQSKKAARLMGRIVDRTARIGVLGLGEGGLPLAVDLAGAGFTITAFDTDQALIASINNGRSQLPDVLRVGLEPLAGRGKFSATSETAALANLDIVSVCTSTPADWAMSAALLPLVRTIEHVAAHLHTGMLVIVESVMYPDATDDVVLAILEGRGLRAGRDFFLAAAPERIAPGNPLVARRKIPKVIGGITHDCRRLASALYGTVVDSVVSVSSTRAAEMVHLLEATFRTVNTALVNELALLCDRMELDVWEVIDAARTKPFDFMPFYPGPGTGASESQIGGAGLWTCRSTSNEEPRLIDVAERVNATMPFAVVDLITEALASQAQTIRGAALLFAGVSGKRQLDEPDSAALSVMTLLAARGAQITYSDPQVATVPASAWGGGARLDSVPLTPAALVEADCVVILTDQIGCAAENIVRHSRLVVDARNVTRRDDRKIFRLGASHRRARLRRIPLPGPPSARPKRSLAKSRGSS